MDEFKDSHSDRLSFYSAAAAGINACGIVTLILAFLCAIGLGYMYAVKGNYISAVISAVSCILCGNFVKAICSCLAIFTEKNFREAHRD